MNNKQILFWLAVGMSIGAWLVWRLRNASEDRLQRRIGFAQVPAEPVPVRD